MFLLRHAAARAARVAPSRSLLAHPRSFASFATPLLPRTQPPCLIASLQRRFASNDAAKTEPAQAAAADTPDNFAQTAAELPLEDGLTPAQQQVQAAPTESNATASQGALREAAKAADQPQGEYRSSRTTLPSGNTLYVGNLFYEVSSDQLKQVFSRFGEIDDVTLVYDGRGLSRGFGYVNFKNAEDAQAAVDNLHMQIFEGRSLVVQFHVSRNNKPRNRDVQRETRPPSETLFIGNMSFEMSDKDLNDLFRDIRNVRDVRVAIDRRTGQPRGFAHADFSDIASATKAKELLQEKVVYGRKLRVDYSNGPTKYQNRPDST